MLNRIAPLMLMALGGLLSVPTPTLAQALTPYVLPLDYDLMAEQGRYLANEAQQLAEFRQFNQALALAQLASQLAPNDGQVLALLGGLYLQAEQIDQAIALLERAKTLAPGEARILFALGSAYFQQGDYLQASTYLEQGLALEPQNANALFDLGNAYLQLQQYDKAMAKYQGSIAAQPDFWPSVNNIGLVFYEQGNTTQAIAKWREALELAGGEEPEPKLAIAVALHQQNNCQVAANVRSEPCQEALTLGFEALEQDSRYSDEAFLRKNLWGNRLLADTQQFYQAPAIKSLLSEL